MVNYYKTLLKASEGDVRAFAQFNSLTPLMDGAAGEWHSWYKWVLLHVAGDDTFAKLLAEQSSKVQEEYITHFSKLFGHRPHSNAKPYIKLHFPKTYSYPFYGEKANQVNEKSKTIYLFVLMCLTLTSIMHV